MIGLAMGRPLAHQLHALGHDRKSAKRAANRAEMPVLTKNSVKSASSPRRYYVISYLINSNVAPRQILRQR